LDLKRRRDGRVLGIGERLETGAGPAGRGLKIAEADGSSARAARCAVRSAGGRAAHWAGSGSGQGIADVDSASVPAGWREHRL
jgi:hypothetical protein